MQPENAGFFLSREKDGFPQRFLWLPTIDPYAPEDRPDPVDQLDVLVPMFNTNCDDRHVVQIPDSVRDEIDAHRHRVLVGDPDVDPLDGHLMLTRLKVAFALAVLQGRKDIDEDEWKIAGDLIDVSVGSATQMRVAIDDAPPPAEHRQGPRPGRPRRHRRGPVRRPIPEACRPSHLPQASPCPQSKARRPSQGVRCTIRGDFDTVFDLFLDKGFIVCCEGRDGHADEFGPEYHRGVSCENDTPFTPPFPQLRGCNSGVKSHPLRPADPRPATTHPTEEPHP